MEKYICDSCGNEIEFDLDVRTENARYTGELIHRVPVCSCLEYLREKHIEIGDLEETIKHLEKILFSIKEDIITIEMLVDASKIKNKSTIKSLLKNNKSRIDNNL